MEKKSTKLTWGLFTASPKYPLNWLRCTCKDIIIVFKRVKFLLKHGYNEQATFETYLYFIDMFDEILEFYRNERMGTPFLMDPEDYDEKENTEHYNKFLDEMRACLPHMREDAITCEEHEKQQEWCNKFFRMFSENFYSFWD